MKNIIFLAALGIFSCSLQKETEIMVIGTIHQAHGYNSDYTFYDLMDMLETYNPDVICVEIPPSYFRKKPYLKEMTAAAVYGMEKGKKVYPIDWWNETINARAERKAFMQTEEYKEKKLKEDTLLKENLLIQDFEKKYGSLENLFSAKKQNGTEKAQVKYGWEFFNGEEFSSYIRESYRISIETYGDSCINLYSDKRNAKMIELIEKAASENRGKRIAVLTGAEHKYAFDDAFRKQKGIKLIEVNSLGALKKAELPEDLTAFIEKGGMISSYYDFASASPNEIDEIYGSALVPLVHGPNMDFNPKIIPHENIEKAHALIGGWEKLNPGSVPFQFDKAWVQFLQKNYADALPIFVSVYENEDKIPEAKRSIIKILCLRNMGFCHDLTGNREKAAASYKECRKTAEESGLDKKTVELLCGNFEKEPYTEK